MVGVTIFMPVRIPPIFRDEIFQSFMEGLFRGQIAERHHVSDGTVSNVVSERKRLHGPEIINQLRSLSIAMSKSGLSFWECVVGHRIVMMLRNMGADEEQFEVLIAKLVDLSMKAGLSPQSLLSEIQELYFFRQTNHGIYNTSVTVSETCEKIKQLQAEAKALKAENQDLTNLNSDLRREKDALESELELESKLKGKLKAKGIRIVDIFEIVDGGAFVKRSGYGIGEVAERFAEFSDLVNANTQIKAENIDERRIHDRLLIENNNLQEQMSQNSLKLRELKLLEEMGLGLRELKMLKNIVNEVATERGITTEEGVRLFLDSLRDHFDDYLDLLRTVKELKSEKAKLQDRQEIMKVSMGISEETIKASEILARKGYRKDDVKRLTSYVVDNYSPSITSSSSIDSKASKNISDSEVDRNVKSESQQELLQGPDSILSLEYDSDSDGVRIPHVENKGNPNLLLQEEGQEEEEEEKEKEFNGTNILDFMSYLKHKALTSNKQKTKLGGSRTENLRGPRSMPRPPRLPPRSSIRTKRYLPSETGNCSPSRFSEFPATAMVKQKHEDPHSAVIADSKSEKYEPSTPNNTSNWHMTARTNINVESIDLVALVDEAITKPILEQLNLELKGDGSLFQPN